MRLAVALLLLVFAVDVASAQTPVSGCRTECTPGDANMNRFDLPVREVLYAHFEEGQRRGRLDLVEPAENESDVADTLSGVGSDSVLFSAILTDAAQPAQDLEAETRTRARPGPYGTVWIGGPIVAFVYVEWGGDALPPGLTIASKMVQGEGSRVETLAAGASSTTGLVMPSSGTPVYEFRVEMAPTAPLWPTATEAGPIAWIVQAYETNVLPAQPFQLRFHTGETFPPRVLVPVFNPLGLESFRVDAQDNATYARLSVSSPFGAHDVADDFYLGVEGPYRVLPDLIELVSVSRRLDHDGHAGPVNVTWRVHVPDDDGRFVFTAYAYNSQRTFVLTPEAANPGPLHPKEVPAAGPGGLACVLLVVLGLWRPRM